VSALTSLSLYSGNTKLAGTAIAVTSKRSSATGTQPLLPGVETVRFSSATANPSQAVNGIHINFQATATDRNVRVPLDGGPIVIEPGAGVCVGCGNADVSLQIAFEGEVFDV
jgi:hypothetical protein